MSAATKVSTIALVAMGMLTIVCLAHEPQVATENCVSDRTLERIESLVSATDGELDLAALNARKEALLSPDNQLESSERDAELEAIDVLEDAIYPPDESQSSNKLDQKVPKHKRLPVGCSTRVKKFFDRIREKYASHRRQRHRRRLLKVWDRIPPSEKNAMKDIVFAYQHSSKFAPTQEGSLQYLEELSGEQISKILRRDTDAFGEELLLLAPILVTSNLDGDHRNVHDILYFCKLYTDKIGGAAELVERDGLKWLANEREAEHEVSDLNMALVSNHLCKVILRSWEKMTYAKRTEILSKTQEE